MTVGIIGSGTMGSGIAQVAATADCSVVIYDTNQEALKHSKTSLDKILSRLVEKQRIQESEKHKITNNIEYVDSIDRLKDADLVIEAIIENLEVKKQVFLKLESMVSQSCIIASNTSSLSIASIASSLKRPERCIGIHFFNPAPLMKLVEVIPAIQTDNGTTEKVISSIEEWGKTVALAKDTPGFIVNRVARPFYGESLRIFEEGIADIPTIDQSLKELGGFRMGPFELMDFIGNDVNYTVTETVFKAFYYDPRYKPSFTQKRLSEAGYFGRKTRKGYYSYDETYSKVGVNINSNAERSRKENGSDSSVNLESDVSQYVFNRVLVMLINEAADALFWNIASAEDIDNAMTKGVNYPKGLLAWADEKGIDWCINKLDKLYHHYHEDRYRCSPLLRQMEKEGRKFFSS